MTRFVFACVGLAGSALAFADTPKVFEVRGKLIGASAPARVRFGEAPTNFEAALWLLRSERSHRPSSAAVSGDGGFSLEYPIRTRAPWLQVEVGDLLVEARLSAPLQEQTLMPLRLPLPAKLRSKVLGAGATPVADALVWLETTESPLPAPWRPSNRKATTAADGGFELAWFPGEKALLNVNAPGYLPGRWEISETVPTHFELTRGPKKGVLRVLANAVEPVPNVLVTLADGRPLGFTDSAGRYDYVLAPKAKLILATATRLSWEVEPAGGETRAYLGGGVLVSGSLLNSVADKVAGAVLEARSAHGALPTVLTHSQADGSWAIGPLVQSDWELLIRASGYADRVVQLARDTLEAAKADLEFGEVFLENETTLNGWVSSAAGPIGGAAIYFLRGAAAEQRRPSLDPPEAPAAAFSGADGRFTLFGLKEGEIVSIEAWAKGFAPCRPLRLKVGSRDEIDLMLPEASRLTASVRLNDARPATLAVVLLEIENEKEGGFVAYGQRGTNEEGIASFVDVPRGTVRVRAEREDFRADEKVLELVAEEEDVSLRLGFGATLEGQVKDLAGQLLPFANVTLLSRPSGAMAIPAEEGRFRFFGLSAGNIEILATAEGHESRRLAVAVPDEGTIQVELQLAPLQNELRGKVFSTTGKPVGGAAVILRREWAPQPGAALTSTSASTTSAADGSFRFERLAREKYFLEVRPVDTRLAPTQFPVFVDDSLKLVEVIVPEMLAQEP